MRWWLFDYAGVIGEHQPDADRRALESVAGPVARDGFWEAYWALRAPYDIGQLSAGEYWHAVGRRLGSAWQPDRIRRLIRLDVSSWLHLRIGTAAFVESLAEAGNRLALLSNAPRELAEAVVDLPISSSFHRLLFSCDLGLAKPQRRCFEAALRELGAAPRDVVFVDDRPDNVAAAELMGMRTVLFVNEPTVLAELTDLAGLAGTPRLSP